MWIIEKCETVEYFNLGHDNTVQSRVLHSELLSEISSRVLSRNEFSRVGTSSEKARITRPNPNFRKTPITETRENENFGKNRLSQGLTFTA